MSLQVHFVSALLKGTSEVLAVVQSVSWMGKITLCSLCGV